VKVEKVKCFGERRGKRTKNRMNRDKKKNKSYVTGKKGMEEDEKLVE
jgi:hypothetical protein